MQTTLTDTQRDCLLFIPQNPKLPIPWHELSHIKEADRKTAIDGLIKLGAIDKRHALNMRGIAHLIVDCNMEFSEILQIYQGVFGAMFHEIHTARKVLETEDAFNIYYYYTFKQYLEWDLFDSNHNFKDLNRKEAIKVGIEIGLKVIDDGRISHDKVLQLFNIPAQLIKDQNITKEHAKHTLVLLQEYF